jgi:hypothetical protein
MFNWELEPIPLSLTFREIPALSCADNATRATALIKFLMLVLCYRYMVKATPVSSKRPRRFWMRSIYGESGCSSDCFPIEQLWSPQPGLFRYRHTHKTCFDRLRINMHLQPCASRSRTRALQLRMRRRCRVCRMFQDQVGGLEKCGL